MIRFAVAASIAALALPMQARAQAAYQACPSTAIEASHVCKGAPGILLGAQITTGASAGFWQIFDLAADPADGVLSSTSGLKYCLAVPANSTTGVGPGLLENYVKGIVFVFSTAADCVHKTESATAWFRGVAQ